MSNELGFGHYTANELIEKLLAAHRRIRELETVWTTDLPTVGGWYWYA